MTVKITVYTKQTHMHKHTQMHTDSNIKIQNSLIFLKYAYILTCTYPYVHKLTKSVNLFYFIL